MTDTEKSICIDINDGWYVKISNNYNESKYIEIGKNLSISEIDDVSDIFNHLILPKQYIDQYGNTIIWEISDRNNLYTLEDIPQEKWPTQIPIECNYHRESGESWMDYDFETSNKMYEFNYFDQTIQNL